MKRFFLAMYTDGPATRWNVIDRQTNEWVRRFTSEEEANDFADKKNMIPLVKVLQWNAAFGPSGNTSERAAIIIQDLCSSLEELSRSADTAELLLKKECPGESASLGAKVSAAISLLRVIRCETCRGFGRIEDLGGGSHACSDCALPPA